MGKRSIFKIIKQEVDEEKRMMEGKNSERETHPFSLQKSSPDNFVDHSAPKVGHVLLVECDGYIS